MAITISEERGVRYLHFATPWIPGAMRIARPYALELEYTRDLMLPLVLRGDPDWPRSVLQVGLGAASVTKFLYRFRPRSYITVVETLEEVCVAAYQYFRMPDDPERVRVEMGDARAYVERSRERFDFIVVDGFDEMGRAGKLDSEPFYRHCRDRLTASGMVAVNLLTRSRGVAASVARLEAAFEGRVLALPPTEAGNTVAICAGGRKVRESLEDLRTGARALREAAGLNLLPVLGRLAAAGATRDGLGL